MAEEQQTFAEKRQIYDNIRRMSAGIPLPTRKSRLYGDQYPVVPEYPVAGAVSRTKEAARKNSKKAVQIPRYPGYQSTLTEGHPFNTRVKRKLKGDLGGEFSMQLRTILSDVPLRESFHCNVLSGRENWYYNNSPVCATTFPQSPNDAKWPPWHFRSKSALETMGTTAIARCAPTNTPAQGATALLELIKDGIPRLPGLLTLKDRNISDFPTEYLGLQFGALPLVRDVKDFRDVVDNTDRILTQFEQGSGSVVRRGYSFPAERTLSETKLVSGHMPAYITPSYTQQYKGDLFRVRETYRKVWFKGAFTYTLPTGYKSRDELGRYRLLANRLGLEITPEVLWNVAPWSWAVDWFANVGDVLENYSAFGTQGLVMKYGYVMEHSYVRDEYRYVGNFGTPRGGNIVVPPLVLISETKQRIKANPFGFGINWDGLNPFQSSIAAALGLSRYR